MKILIMGLPGSGKTTLAESLAHELDCDHFNADKVREQFNDWDFTAEGRLRQARRMRELADKTDLAICDFVCPLPEMREIFGADVVIWMDTIKKPNALRKELGVKEGKTIPAKKLAAAAKKPGKTGQRARLAETLKGLKKK